MYVGIVRGSGKNDQAGAKEAFQKALGTDPTVKLDTQLATPETQKTFEGLGGRWHAARRRDADAGSRGRCQRRRRRQGRPEVHARRA